MAFRRHPEPRPQQFGPGAVPAEPGVEIGGVGFSAAQFLLARAFAAAPAGVVLPLDFTRLLFAFAAGTVFFADPFDLASGFGGTLIFAAALLVTLAPDTMRKMAQTRNKR